MKEWRRLGEAARAQRGASRERYFFYIVFLDPAYKAGVCDPLAGHSKMENSV
jgi:hypothetical protein